MGIAVGDGIHRPLMRLIGRIGAVGSVLMETVQRIRRRRAGGDAADDAPPRHDVDRAWELVGETIRWMRVLMVRLTGNIVAAKAALLQAEAAARGGIEPPETAAAEADPGKPVRDKKRGPREPDPDRAIRRKSIAQILEQVCADLGAVAALLGDTEAAREVATIVGALRALLDGAVEVVAAVVSRPVSHVMAAVGPGVSKIAAAAASVRAPDSG
jgi:hypothetical protein